MTKKHQRLLPLLGAALIQACTPAAAPPEAVRAVRTMVLQAEDTAGVAEFAAEVRARTEIRLGFRVPGKLISRTAEVGQRVKAGQRLAQLDPTDLLLGQRAAQASVRAAQSAFALTQAEFKRYQELRSQGFISAIELERRETALLAQKSQLEQALAQQDVQANQAAYASLSTAVAGVVVGVEAEVGAVLAAGSTVIRLAQDGPRDAVFSVPEDSVASLRLLLGRPHAVQVRTWGAGASFPATVREVAAAADPTSRTFLVKADLGAAVLELGQTVTAQIPQPRSEGVLRLPLGAVTQHNGQSTVWLLDRASMSVKPQAVVVAGADGNTLVVTSGVLPGQTVVTAGVHTLTPGQKVRLFEPAPPTKPAAAPASQASQ